LPLTASAALALALLASCHGGAAGGPATASSTGADTSTSATASASSTSAGTTTSSTSSTATETSAAGPPYVALTLLGSQSDPDLGAGQGVARRDGRIYAYGDRQGTGVIREYDVVAGDPPTLAYSGREVLLQANGVDRIPHPTGLTWRPEHGTFLGNTVAGVGTIFVVDWDALWTEGDLDNAILAEVADDLLTGGTRPELVPVAGAWRLASAGYLEADNTLRLFDPEVLKAAAATSDPGVLVSAAAIGPWVQSLAYVDALDLLIAAQNLAYGGGWRLSVAPLTADGDLGEVQVIEEDLPSGELEGVAWLGVDTYAVLVTSAAADNLWIAALDPL
jgi:hypothetical protein